MVSINQKLRKDLIEGLSNALVSLEVKGHFLSYDAHEKLIAVDDIIHDSKRSRSAEISLKASLVAMIDDHPIADFTIDYINNLLIEGAIKLGTDNSSKEYLLFDILADRQPSDLAEEIISSIATLPFNYTFSVPLTPSLGSLLPSSMEAWPINDEIRLVRVTPAFWSKFPETEPTSSRRLAEVFSDYTSRPFEAGTTVLQIDAKGYTQAYRSTATANNALLLAKAFFGLGSALGLLTNNFAALVRGQQREVMAIHRTVPPEWIGKRPFDYDADDYLKKLAPMDSELFKLGGALGGYGRLQERLALIGRCLSPGDDARRLRLAGRWFFDSSATSDEVTGFVQSMIVLETLLGEEDAASRSGLSLGSLLRNRCAYLLGRNRSERQEIIDKFTQIYQVRSAIVHNGHHQLSFSDRRLLYELRVLCARVIREESRQLVSS